MANSFNTHFISKLTSTNWYHFYDFWSKDAIPRIEIYHGGGGGGGCSHLNLRQEVKNSGEAHMNETLKCWSQTLFHASNQNP